MELWMCTECACGPRVKKTGMQMNFGFIASLVLAILAIVGVFINIPVISQYAFWVAVAAYIVLAGLRK
jgi:TctA family transporter